MGSPLEITTQTQFIANLKTLLELTGTTLRNWGPKYGLWHLDQGAFKGKKHILVSFSAVVGEVLCKAAV